MPFEPLDLPRQAVEAPGEHRLEPLLLIGCEQGCERGFDDIGSRHAPAARPFVALAAKRGIEAEGPFDRGPFPRSIPSPGSRDALRALRCLARSMARRTRAALLPLPPASKSNPCNSGRQPADI